jgi:hypothetical protein
LTVARVVAPIFKATLAVSWGVATRIAITAISWREVVSWTSAQLPFWE